MWQCLDAGFFLPVPQDVRHGAGIIFQCDHEYKYFVKQKGLQHNVVEQKNLIPDKNYNNDAAYHDNETHARILSDLVAWLNNKGKESDGVISINFADILEKESRHVFR